jgi:hypothetical protein
MAGHALLSFGVAPRPGLGRRCSRVLGLLLGSALVGVCQTVAAAGLMFDFDAGPVHTSTPFSQTVSGVTAQFTASGQGFSIQPADTLGWTPKGFSGLAVYPNSVYPSDLTVSFSQPLRVFQIKFAPEEYACDSSATMQIQAFRSGVLVGTATAHAPHPGTWPTGLLKIKPGKPFDTVVIHYLSPPPTGGDWGPIFMADKMKVGLAP